MRFWMSHRGHEERERELGGGNRFSNYELAIEKDGLR